jgi:hypothetical protein
MPTLAGFPYVALKFNKKGERSGSGPIRPNDITDLVVISHGWHQDPVSAQTMYEQMLGHVAAEAQGRFDTRRIGVTGVFWPSDQWRDDLSEETVAILQDGGAAAATGDVGLDKLLTLAGDMAGTLNFTRARLRQLVSDAAQGGPGDKDALIDALRAKAKAMGPTDEELAAEHRELLDPDERGRDIIERLKGANARGVAARAAGEAQAAALGIGVHGAQGGAAGWGLLSGPVAAIATVLNQAAYFALKKRAGVIGQALGKLLDADGLLNVRLHLIGHSFGARLVTAATSTMALRPYSLTLVQGAFSHNALGVDIKPGLNGAYRNVIAQRKVEKRIVITHTWNDKAVGVAYAVASRASNEIAAGLLRTTPTFGGALDLHGGMGANGALRLKPGEGASQVFTGVGVPSFDTGVFNVKCDFITSHTDIRRDDVGRLLVAALN